MTIKGLRGQRPGHRLLAGPRDGRADPRKDVLTLPLKTVSIPEMQVGEPSNPLPLNSSHSASNGISLPRNVPVILLPGIMGSRLFFPDIGQFWDPDDSERMMFWAFQRCEPLRGYLHYQSPAQVMTAINPTIKDILPGPGGAQPIWGALPVPKRGWRGWESVVSKFYRSLLVALDGKSFVPEDVTCNAYAIGYDFRQSNLDSGRAAATRTRQILTEESADGFILVTHSMGGLVARSMLQSDHDLAKKAELVIHIMQPAWGAPYFYDALFRGLAYGSLTNPGLGMALGDTGEEFMTVASGQRGAVELLPNNAYIESHQKGTVDAAGWLRQRSIGDTEFAAGRTGDVYDVYLSDEMDQPGLLWMTKCLDKRRGTNSVSITEQMRARINEARQFHEVLRDFGALDITQAICGSGLKTCVGVDFIFDREKHMAFERSSSKERRPGISPRESNDGDDTVSVASASGKGIASKTQSISKASHRDGCKNQVLIDAVKEMICNFLRGAPCRK